MSESQIHPTAVVHPSAEIGAGCRIGPFAVIEEDVVLGDGCSVHSHAVIKRYTRLGQGNQVFETAVLGGVPQDLKYEGGRSYLFVGDGNVFREGVTINRSTEPDGVTRIGSHCFFMTCSHVAHECVVGDHVVLANCVALAGHVRIEDRCFLSGGVVVHQFSRVGKYAMIGGNAKVIQDVLPFLLIDGVPAKTRALNLVGLRRGGFSRDEIRALKQAFRTLAQAGPSRQEKLVQLAELDSESVRYLAKFIENSKRGYSGFVER